MAQTTQELWQSKRERLVAIAGCEEQAHWLMAMFQANVLLDGSSTKEIANMLIKGVEASPTLDSFIDVDGYEDDVDSFNELLEEIETFFLANQ